MENAPYLYYKSLEMNVENEVCIIPFTSEFKEEIKILNLEWLNKYFKVEAKDDIMLSDPQGEIIDKGGLIFYAKYNHKIVGTVSLLKIDETTFELSKMAVTDGVQGIGIGQKLPQHCLFIANEKGIKKLILYSNRKLLAAIYLYQKFGFKEVPLESGNYERADSKMEKSLS
jgi:N-acetylglutamate synthase-like GNAT family acetyltransferase